MGSAESELEVLLIKPNVDIRNRVPPLGLGYLASALIKNGIKNGRKYAEENFSRKIYVQRYEDLLLRIIKKKVNI